MGHSLFALAVSDYKRLNTSLHFVITSFHTELKHHIKVTHDINSLPLLLAQTQLLINHGQLVNHKALNRFG